MMMNTIEKVVVVGMAMISVRILAVTIVALIVTACNASELTKEQVLWDAIANNDVKMVIAAIEGGANLNETNEEGETALDQAQLFGYAEMISVIREHGGKAGEVPPVPEEFLPVEKQPEVSNGIRTPDQKLLFKGLWPGMSVDKAMIRLKELGLPAGKTVKTGRIRRGGEDMDVFEFQEVTAVDGSGKLSRSGENLWALLYDPKTLEVTTFQFRKSTVIALFNCKDMEVKQFAETFMESYGITQMDAVLTHNWGFEYTDRAGWKVRIEEDYTLTVEVVATASQRTFD
jgi:hypothetical protein